MKLISFAVPCYNSSAYMQKCIDSLLTGGDEVEIIIINDGSVDETHGIAEHYASRYPNTIRAVHKENGGHGSGVNRGLLEATGLYYKVVDSDDWLNPYALKSLLDTVRKHVEEGFSPDLYITNFVYEHVADDTQFVSHYSDKFPEEIICDWEKMGALKYSRMLLMHALMYKREKLLESNTILPEHTFYVDNLFAYKPLPHMKSIYYINLDLYRYFIGRSDQSINISNFVKRYEQQIRVILEMTKSYTYNEIKKQPRGLRKYMWHALEVVMMNTIFFTCAEDSPERRKALSDMWAQVKQQDKKLFKKLRYRSYAIIVNFLPWGLRKKIMSYGYDVLCKKVKLG